MSQHGCPERLSNRSKGFQEDGTSQPTMEVLVETLTGTAFEMTVSPSDTVFTIKSKIFRVEGIPVSQQHILYNLKELDDGSSLHDLSISDGAKLRLVLGMRGGPISTRRLPPPSNIEPWKDIERLLENHRDDSDWTNNGCKMTVLVFRDGERVNLLRVKENQDGSYSPIDNNKYSSSLTQLVESEADDAVVNSVQENAITMGKMIALRRRMDQLALRRSGDKAEIQKTRSEETLSVPSLLDEASGLNKKYPYTDIDGVTPMYDGNYTRYDYDCSFSDRYTLLPPIGTRNNSEQSGQETDNERVKLSDALAGSILVKGRREKKDGAAILEECLNTGVDECHIKQDTPQLTAKNLSPITAAAEYGGVACGSAGTALGWRGFGSSSELSPGGHSALTHRHPPLSTSLFSSSTSSLETLKRNRILPALSRHRNREHLHLSDERLDVQDNTEKPRTKIRCTFCRKRLSIATVHSCRCGAQYCAAHRYAEVHGCAYDYRAGLPEI